MLQKHPERRRPQITTDFAQKCQRPAEAQREVKQPGMEEAKRWCTQKKVHSNPGQGRGKTETERERENGHPNATENTNVFGSGEYQRPEALKFLNFF